MYRSLSDRHKKGHSMPGNIKIFGNSAGGQLAHDISQRLSIEPGLVKLKQFKDGELWDQLQTEVRGHDVYLICPTPPPAENFLEALFLADAARHASADRITMVIPYFGYSRQDRKDAPRTAYGAYVCARALRADVDRVLLLDMHSEQTNGLFRPAIVDHVYGSVIFLPKLKEILKGRKFVVAAPDVGAGARAKKYNKLLGNPRKLVYFDKNREEAGKVDSVEIVGTVKGYFVVLTDDIVDSGGTLVADAEAAMEAAATGVMATIAHGVLSDGSIEMIDNSPISILLLSDSIVDVWDKQKLFKNTEVIVVTCAGLLADAIRRTHDEESVSKLIL